jgi:phosphoribulokinase
MRPGLVHPELSQVIDGETGGISLLTRGSESSLWVPGAISATRSATIEEAVWDRMHFASHLRTERLGEFTVGTALHRSEPLAITQLLVLYQLVTARAAIALGAEHARADRPEVVATAPVR